MSVLNALRHHCEEDPWPLHLDGCGRGRVLNALRHHCEEDVDRHDGEAVRGSVLNALRHHCEEDLSIAAHGTGRNLVLNALRHHCEEDTAPRGCGADGPTCAQRLAASLRGGLRKDLVEEAYFYACSTPCGITARRTRRAVRVLARPSSAQRLAASLRGGRSRDPAPRTAGHDVLNALRHHCEEDGTATRGPSTTSLGAQRLAASLRGGPSLPTLPKSNPNSPTLSSTPPAPPCTPSRGLPPTFKNRVPPPICTSF
jgi:hypothetical protein